MKKIGIILTFIFLFLGTNSKCAPENNERPNILVILCDDLGYGDVSFNGSPDIKTPNLDKLANRGITFTSAYVSHPFCGPSRASIMTGRYPQAIGTPYNLRDSGIRPNYGVPETETFMSRVLKDAGYHTMAIGKWHLGFSPRFQPNNRGFDEFYGFLAGGHDYFPQNFTPAYQKQKKAGVYPIREYIKPLLHNNTEIEETEYITDAFSREAIRMINESAKGNKPFFMYLAYNAPHVPLQAKKEDVALFKDIKDEDRRNYAAMVYAVDRGVGGIVNTLKENDIFDNTLIVFLSDNGGNTDHGASNYPLKGKKGDTWEGGFRSPMFYCWPAKIKADQVVDSPVSSLDLYPTFASLAGAQIPENKVLDGIDLSAAIKAEAEFNTTRLIQVLRYREGYCDVGIRQGDWKAVRMKNEPWNLFNITDDKREHHNKSGRYPEKLKELVGKSKQWSTTHISPLWYYSAKDEELWNDGTLPGYDHTYEVDKLVLPPTDLQLQKK